MQTLTIVHIYPVQLTEKQRQMHPFSLPELLQSNFNNSSILQSQIQACIVYHLSNREARHSFSLIMAYGFCFDFSPLELQENLKEILKSPFSSLPLRHFNKQQMGITVFTVSLSLNLPRYLSLVVFNSFQCQVSLYLVPEISLPGIFHSRFW